MKSSKNKIKKIKNNKITDSEEEEEESLSSGENLDSLSDSESLSGSFSDASEENNDNSDGSEEDTDNSNGSEENTDNSNGSEEDFISEQKIKDHLKNINDRLPIRILTVKKNLLEAYLMNLKIYQELKEKNDHPVKDSLIKLSILLKKVISMEEKIDHKIRKTLENKKDGKLEFKPCLEENDKRKATYEMLKNKGITRKRKKEDRNPRVKNRRKADELKEKGKKRVDVCIDTKKTKISKL